MEGLLVHHLMLTYSFKVSPLHISVQIYTIKTRLEYIYMCICVRIYMFICSELIEETRRPPGLIFGM